MENLRVIYKTSNSWSSENEILEDSVIGIETDTKKAKLGNGVSRWNDLNYSGLYINKNSYTVLLSQVEEGAPTVNILQDEIGGISWSRVSAGVYKATSNGKFKENKTIPVRDSYTDFTGNIFNAEWLNENEISLTTYAAEDTVNPADGVLDNQYFNIEIYK